MTQPLRSRLRRHISRIGLLPPALFLWRSLRTWSPSTIIGNRAARKNTVLPIPPNSLIFSATGTRHVEWFLRSGADFAQALRNALDEIGRPITSFSRVLDFGCGPGRVVRHWATIDGPAFFGCDYNPRSVAWDQQNLEFARFSQNSLAPPLPYESRAFDLCYSVSVLPTCLTRFNGHGSRRCIASWRPVEYLFSH
jgi:SAM-dependent methyltransferase